MADNNNKTIKFAFDLDSTSFARVKQGIEQLTNALKELARVAGSINLNTGGIAPGGNIGGMLSGISTQKQQPGIPSIHQSQQPTNVAGVLTQGLTADRNIFRTVAEGSKEALRAMKDALRQTVDEQSKDIQRLRKEIDGLASSYNKLNQNDYTKPLAQAEFGRMTDKASELAKLTRARNQNQNTLEESGAGGGGVSSLLKQVGLGGLLSYAGAGGAALGAYKAFQYGSEAYYNNRTAVLNEQINGPLDRINQRAAVMSSFGQTALGIRGGDVGLALGTTRWMHDREVRNLMGSTNRQQRANLAGIQAGYQISPGGIYNGIKDTVGATLGQFGGSIDSVSGGTSAQALKLKNLLNEIPAGQAQQAQQAINAYANIDPLLRQRANEFYSGALGKFALQRAVGISSVNRQGQWHDVAAQFEVNALNQGIDPGQLAGAIDAAKFTVGYRNRFQGQSFLNRQFGGFANAAQVYAAGQEFGSGRGLLNTFAGRGGIAGRGGVDPLASSRIAEVVMSQMYGSRFGGIQGEGLTQALGSLSAMAGDVGGQLRLARGAGAGMQNLGASLAGSIDPLQQAINAYAGAGTFGGKFYQMNAMTQLSGGDLIEMLRTGKVNQRLGDLGINIDQVRQYAGERDKFALSRYQMGQGGGPMDALVGSARAAGGPQEYIRQQLQGLSGRNKNQRFFELTRQLGGAMAASTGGSSEEFIRGLQLEMAADVGVTGSLRGRGVGDPTSRKGLEQAAVSAEAEKKRADKEEVEKNQKTLRDAFGIMGKLPDTLQNVGVGLLAGEQRLEKSLGDLAFYIDSVVLHKKVNRDDYNNPIETPPVATPKSKSTSNIEKSVITARKMRGAGGGI